MKQKTGSKLLGVLLTLAMVVGLVPGMSLTALADGTTGTQLTADTTNPSEGTYYLNSDVALNSEMNITSGNVVINLNGHTLSLKSGADSWQSVIYVAGGNLTVNGGTISGGTGGHNQRGGGFHIDGGNVTVNNVDITGNNGAWGGGVFINSGTGTFTMNNSHIRNNTSINDGHGWNDAGGAYLDGGVFTINGGSITDNTVEGNKKNGLVLANNDAKLNISGDVLIYNNKDGDTQENLHADALFGGASPINITGSLGQNAIIGITSQCHRVFTSSVNTDNNDPTKFVSDSSDYRVGRNTDGQLMLANYNEIIYKTTGYDGVYDGQKHGIKVVASDPDTAIIRYGTSADNCTMEQSPVFKDASETRVYYEITAPVSGDNINYEPVKGSAVVKINRATPSTNDFTYEAPSDLTYDGSAKAATVVSTQSGMGNVTVKYYSDPERETEVQSPTDVGTYYVGITLDEGNNYHNASSALYDQDWQFTISKQGAPTSLNDNQKPTANTGLTYTGNELELVTAPASALTGYTVQYSLDGTNWSTDIPKGTNAGDYTVKVKYVGDENHEDFNGTDISVTIAKVAAPTLTDDQKPTAKTGLTYTGSDQALVTAPSEIPDGYIEVQYAIGDANGAAQPYTTSIPTATNAGSYYVWYKAVGDENHLDSEAKCVTVTIAEKGEPAAEATLSFDANGGTGTMDKVVADKGSKVALPACTFKRDGHAFSGWNTQADGKGTAYADKAEVTLDADVTLYAQWTKDPDPVPTKPTYAVTSGSGSAWAEGSSGALTFTFKRSERDEETFRRFRSASVDGKLLTRDRDYKASAGSVVIELQPSYLATLAAGEHTLTATFDDGTAEAKFTVTGAAPEKDYPSPEVSNSRGGAITSKADPVTFTVSQKVPAEATSVRTWAELEGVFALTHGKEGVAVTVDGQPFQGADVAIEGQRVTVSVADATALRGKTLSFSYTAKLKDGADLSAYLNADKSIASVPYRASTTFDGDEDTVYGSTTEYVKFNVGAPKSGGTTPAVRPALPRTGDPAPLAAAATLAATGAAFAAAGMRRRRKDQ